MVGHGYEEKFNDVMRFTKVRVADIRTKEDLREIIKRIDEERKDKEGDPRFKDESGFVDKLLDTKAAEKLIGKRVTFWRGRPSVSGDAEPPTYVVKAPPIARAPTTPLLYLFARGTATKTTVVQRGKPVSRFTDTATGKTVRRTSILFTHPNGYAREIHYKQRDKPQVRFQDTTTRRFVARRLIVL